MLQIHDIRESRLYQEAKEVDLKEGIEKGIEIAITRMAAKKLSASEIATIATILQLDEATVREALAKASRN